MINDFSLSDSLVLSVEGQFSGVRLDKVLGELCDDLSRARLKALILDGKVLVDEQVIKQPSFKLSAGQDIIVFIPEAQPCEPEAEDIPLDILYEDEDVIVVNKPVGLVVHPGAGNWTGTLVNALLYHCGDSLSGIGGVIRPGIVHRLDKNTSGAMIVAKNDFAHQHLSDQLKDRSLTRIYHALVLGVPMPIKGSVDRPIGRHKHNRLKMCVGGSGARDAKTYYQVVESYSEYFSLVECKLETGRTHQIRVHMEELGHPILGDPLYGPQKTKLTSFLKKSLYSSEINEKIVNCNVQSLHARYIRFVHPRSGEVHEYESPLNLEFELLKKYFKNTSYR